MCLKLFAIHYALCTTRCALSAHYLCAMGLCIVHCVLYATHYALYTICCALCIVHYAQCIVRCMLRVTHYLCTIRFALCPA